MIRFFKMPIVFTVMLLLVLLNVQVSAAQDDLPVYGAYAEVNGIEMYYEVQGEGEPLLLIHGAIGTTDDFAEVLPAFLEAGYQTIAFDCRGRGRSTDSGEMLSYGLMAEDTVALMDELGIERASIVGQSDGAMIGLHLAIHYPERVDKLISYGANFNVNGLLPGNIAWLESVTHADFEAMIGDAYRGYAPDPDHLPVLLEQLRHMFLTQPNFTIYDLMGIEAEVLVFDGEEEDTVRIEHARQMAAAIPNASMVILPDTGHHLMYEDPETYLDYAIPFLLGELDAPPDGKYAAVNDIAMYYEIHGEGEPVVLMHSVAAYMAQLDDVASTLAENYQVITLDLRGHGRTTHSVQPLTYELMASDVVALLDHLGIDAAHVVGNKDGGIVGLVMAQETPERVKSLVTASVNWTYTGFQPWFPKWVKQVTAADFDDMVGDVYRAIAPDPSIVPLMTEKTRYLLLTQPDFTLDALSDIDIAVLVLAGTDEDVLLLDQVEKMAGAIPNAELVLIEGGTHSVLDEQFDAWMDAVSAFLAQVSRLQTYAHPEMLVSATWLAAHLDDPHLRILDTRDALAEGDPAARFAAYEAGHIPGALYVDPMNDISDPNGGTPLRILPSVEFEALMGRLGISNDTTVVVYDDAGNAWSARLWWALRYYGHDNVKLLNGGLTKWMLDEHPLQTSVDEPEPAVFHAEVQPALLASKEDVLAAISDPDVVIIDSLEPAFYSGEQSWPDMRAGHIPTAKNIFVRDNLDPDDLTLLPMESLMALWQKADLKPGQEVITYCGAGYYGALNLFVLNQLGYEDARLYDGSWMEWGADLSLPVETGNPETQQVPRLEPTECKYPDLEGLNAECSYLSVKEDRGDVGSPIIRVHVIKVAAASQDPAPDPIVVIPGGPGASGPFYAWLFGASPIGEAMRAERDLYILEPRGAMYSDPAFYCPEVEGDWTEMVAMNFSEEVAWNQEAYRACHDRLIAEGVNLSAYGFLDLAGDIADLHAVLGVEEINVYGVSYGTTPVMLFLNEYPERTRSVILDSIIPPDVVFMEHVLTNVSAAIEGVFAACEADDVCAAAYPNLQTVYADLLTQLREEPVDVIVTDDAGQEYTVVIDDVKFVFFTYDNIFIGEGYAALPALVFAAADGDLQAPASLWLGYISDHGSPQTAEAGAWAKGMSLSAMCMQDASVSNMAKMKAIFAEVETLPSIRDWVTTYYLGNWHQPCGYWQATPPEPNIAVEPVESDIPTLMLTGIFDPEAPASLSKETAAGFSNGHFYALPAGHGLVFTECALELITQFLANPTQAPDASCVDEMAPNWVLPE